MTKGQIEIYTTDKGTEIEVKLEQETIWFSQFQMSELMEKNVRTINEHIKNIYKTGKLGQSSTIRNFRIVRQEGRREVTRHWRT